MIEFLTLITLMCTQSGVGHGVSDISYSVKLRQEAFSAQSQCIKRLYKACPVKGSYDYISKAHTDCLVNSL
jgi:hypothetical protein